MTRRRIYSGMCICGHKVSAHHCYIIVSPEVVEETQSQVSPGGCCAYGSNEYEGLGPDEEDHCGNYVDVGDPNLQRLASWKGITALDLAAKKVDKLQSELAAARRAISPFGVSEGHLPGLIESMMGQLSDLQKAVSLLPGVDNPRSPQDIMDVVTKLDYLEKALSVQQKATGEEMLKREHMERNWNQMVKNIREYHEKAERLQAEMWLLKGESASGALAWCEPIKCSHCKRPHDAHMTSDNDCPCQQGPGHGAG